MGIFNFIKSALGGNTDKEPQPNDDQKLGDNSYQKIIDIAHKEMVSKGHSYWWSIKTAEIDSYKNNLLTLTNKQKIGFIIWAFKIESHFHTSTKSYSSVDKSYQKVQIAGAFYHQLLRSKLIMDEDDIDMLLETIYGNSKYSTGSILHWPVNLLVNQIVKQFSEAPLSERLTNVLQKLHLKIQEDNNYYDQKEKQKIIGKLDVLFYNKEGNDNNIKPTFFPAKDAFGTYANTAIEAMDSTSQQQFFKIMLLAQKATSGKPSAKYLTEIQTLYKEFGADKYKALINDWMLFITALKEIKETHTTPHYTYDTYEFIATINTDMIKGLIWSLVHFFDKSTLFNIAQLADRAYRKIPGKGPASAAIGNACLYVLANVKGMDGIGHLSRLRLRIKQATKLKKIKETIKQIELTTTAQRDRLDRMFVSNRSIKAPDFETNYLQNGLMQYLAHKIIWTVEQNGNKVSVIYSNGQWANNANEVIPVAFTDEVMVSLWHPVFSSVEDIKNWRVFMLQHQIVQPLKQAYREVYLLTDAEINTKSYSNRMAAHIIKQHQFNSLAKARGWSYALQGGWDGGGYNSNATHVLKEYNLRAEFWINELGDTDAMNDIGIWLYMATDQVRFTDTVSNAVKDLIDIPAIVFTEVMRDVDLFVGVASVGNDPNWIDSGGLPATYNTYWQSYSFGDLTEIAKTRKSILENLLPRLKIAPLAHIKDKFLVVKGKLRTYKIHIGSTNILMEPNDQYLCIVPDRSKKENTETTFLPFEGDAGLSVILSKAMLLVDDDKITDTTITSQINRK